MDTLQRIVFPAAEEFRLTLDDPESLELSADTPLIGDRSPLDSLALVSFLVVVEEKAEEMVGRPLRLVSEKAMAAASSPFRTFGTLAAYIDELIAESPQ